MNNNIRKQRVYLVLEYTARNNGTVVVAVYGNQHDAIKAALRKSKVYQNGITYHVIKKSVQGGITLTDMTNFVRIVDSLNERSNK